MRPRRQIISILSGLIFLCSQTSGSPPAFAWRWLERDWGAALVPGPYRSYGSLFVDLDPEEDFLIWQEEELPLYRDLARSSVRPGYLLLELTGYPLAMVPAWAEEDQNQLYHALDIGPEFNLLRSLGAGYQEPWSVSLFQGQLATFWTLDAQDELAVAARGAAGFVMTGGFQQLFDNSVVTAPWFRVEWKIKGEGLEGSKRRFWDLKAGYRWYGIPEVANTVSISLERRRTDKERWDWRPAGNSLAAVDVQLPLTELTGGPSRLFLEYAKLFPVWKVLVGMKLGYLYQYRPVYDRETSIFSSERERDWEIILQPLVIF